jgi:hypothetical protein
VSGSQMSEMIRSNTSWAAYCSAASPVAAQVMSWPSRSSSNRTIRATSEQSSINKIRIVILRQQQRHHSHRNGDHHGHGFKCVKSETTNCCGHYTGIDYQINQNTGSSLITFCLMNELPYTTM